MPEELGFDRDAATRWVEGLGIPVDPPLTFAPIHGGRSNLTSVVRDSAGRRWVTRRGPLGQHLASAHDVRREHHVLMRLSRTACPAPRVLGLCEDPQVSDSPIILMEYVDGRVIDERAARLLDPTTRHALGLATVEALVAVHDVDIERAGLTDFASHAPYAARQLKRWRTQWEQSRTRDLPAVTDLAARLERAAPAEGEPCLVHGDFHILNMIFEREGTAVRAIVDWELCTLGNPIADLGSLLAWPQPGSQRLGPGVFAISTLPGFPTRSQLADAYAASSGRDISTLPYWEALACWKIAIIVDGVLRRRLDQPDGQPPAGEQLDSSVIEGMLERAQAAADAAGI